MIDRKTRDEFAELLRHFCAGLITNDQFEDRLGGASDWGMESDPAVREIFYRGIWPMYDDLHEHKLTDDYALTQEGKTFFARVILFLKTDLPYEWAPCQGFKEYCISILSVLTFGLLNLMRRRIPDKRGERNVWPFFRQHDYEQALGKQPYMREAPNQQIQAIAQSGST